MGTAMGFTVLRPEEVVVRPGSRVVEAAGFSVSTLRLEVLARPVEALGDAIVGCGSGAEGDWFWERI